MGPSELLTSGLIATALVAPVSLAIEGSRPAADMTRYVMQNDCPVIERVDVTTTCIVDQLTGERLGS